METILSLCLLLPPGKEPFCSKMTNQGVFGEKQEVHQEMWTSGKMREPHQAAHRQNWEHISDRGPSNIKTSKLGAIPDRQKLRESQERRKCPIYFLSALFLTSQSGLGSLQFPQRS